MSNRVPAITVDLDRCWAPPRWPYDADHHPIKREIPLRPLPASLGHTFGDTENLECRHCGASWFSHREEPRACPSKENT
jgi:hypothetical protein